MRNRYTFNIKPQSLVTIMNERSLFLKYVLNARFLEMK